MEPSSGKCPRTKLVIHRTILMISQYCFWWWLGAIRQQSIIIHSVITWRCLMTRSPGRCSAVPSLSCQVLFMALIIQHGLYMLGRVLSLVHDWVRISDTVSALGYGLIKNWFQMEVHHPLESFSCTSRGVSDVLRQTVEQPGTLDIDRGFSKCLYGWQGCGCDARYTAFSTIPGVPLGLYRFERVIWHSPFIDAPCMDNLITFMTRVQRLSAESCFH